MAERSFKEIIQFNDLKKGAILRKKTKQISSINNDVKNLFRDLEILAKKNSKEGITLVGLSAPQVGWDVAAFIFYDLQKRKYFEVINPTLVYTSKESTTEWEGCASIGSGQTSLFGPVQRPRMSQIKYMTLEGEEKIFSGSNYQSHILLHEMDHLDGVLFLDKVADPKMILSARDLDEYAKKNSGKYPPV